jgi:ribosomal protein S21|tara:strand:- start:2791 stop:3021 length:231 start_codon:yes stop_codon:yes gene_type:complete
MSKTVTRLTVKSKNSDDNVEKLIKRFIRKTKKQGIIKELRDRRYFEKPSKIRHERNIRIKRDLDKNRKKRESKRES